MPFIDPNDGRLTVVNLFRTDTAANVDRLVDEMRAVVDAAAYEGWISSTVHRGVEKFGTANFIQWRGEQDLETRYAGTEFKHHTIPVFRQITTYVRLMHTEVHSSRSAETGLDGVEIAPERADHTVIEVLDVAPTDQDALLSVIDEAFDRLRYVNGFRSQTVLRGIRSRRTDDSEAGLATIGTDRDFVVVYSQWADAAAYEAYRAGDAGQENERRRAPLVTSVEHNTYRPVHTRSAQPVG